MERLYSTTFPPALSLERVLLRVKFLARAVIARVRTVDGDHAVCLDPIKQSARTPPNNKKEKTYHRALFRPPGIRGRDIHHHLRLSLQMHNGLTAFVLRVDPARTLAELHPAQDLSARLTRDAVEFVRVGFDVHDVYGVHVACVESGEEGVCVDCTGV